MARRCTYIVEDRLREQRESMGSGVLATVGKGSVVSTEANGKSRYTTYHPQTSGTSTWRASKACINYARDKFRFHQRCLRAAPVNRHAIHIIFVHVLVTFLVPL